VKDETEKAAKDAAFYLIIIEIILET